MKRFSRPSRSLSLWLFTACVLLNLAAACAGECNVATNGVDDHWLGPIGHALCRSQRRPFGFAHCRPGCGSPGRRAAGAAAEAMTVCVRGGVYRLDPWAWRGSQIDSGTA